LYEGENSSLRRRIWRVAGRQLGRHGAATIALHRRSEQRDPKRFGRQLNAAAAALAAVSRVHQDYQKRIAAAASPDDKKRIVEEANKALEKAITDKGLSIDEYNAIVDVAQNDPEFKAKLIQRARGILSQ
jgi:hypothetical protein